MPALYFIGVLVLLILGAFIYVVLKRSKRFNAFMRDLLRDVNEEEDADRLCQDLDSMKQDAHKLSERKKAEAMKSKEDAKKLAKASKGGKR